MRRILLALPWFLLSMLWVLPALAGNWRENWGSMIWGSVAAVPTMGWLGGAYCEIPDDLPQHEGWPDGFGPPA